LFSQYLEQYATYISCVLFFGGEWSSGELISKLKISRNYQMKTCLYTGLEKIPQRIIQHLDYLKTGPWIKERGGLDSETSNQRFVDLATGNVLNKLFSTRSSETEMH
jgi:anaerobic ribonucleoside-triphosphate reductase activating protein